MRGQPTSFPIWPAGLFRQASLTHDGPETRIGLQRPQHGVAFEVDKFGITAGDSSAQQLQGPVIFSEGGVGHGKE